MKPWILGGPPPQADRLSPREREVRDLVRRGLSNKEIASALGCAEGTVKIHMTGIFRKLGIFQRSDLGDDEQPNYCRCGSVADSTERFPCRGCGKPICVHCKGILAAGYWVCDGCGDGMLSRRAGRKSAGPGMKELRA